MARCINVVCLGDSLTNGGYPDALQELLNEREPSCRWNVKQLGVIGSGTKEWITTHLQSDQRRALQAGGVDVYVLMLGTNDAQTGCRLTFDGGRPYAQQLATVARSLLSEGVPLILMSPPPMDVRGSFGSFIAPDLLAVTPRIVSEVANELGCPFVNLFPHFGGENPHPQAFVDGVHLSKEGNFTLANAVLSEIVRIVSGRSGAAAAQPMLMQQPQGMPPQALVPQPQVEYSYAPVVAPQLQVVPQSQAASQIPQVVSAQPLAVPPAPQGLSQQPQSLPLVPTSVADAIVPLEANPLVAAAKGLKANARPQADYQVGDRVEVFSKTFDAWFIGKIAKRKENRVLAEFTAPNGAEKEKWMPIGHADLRPLEQTSRKATSDSTELNGPNATLSLGAIVAPSAKFVASELNQQAVQPLAGLPVPASAPPPLLSARGNVLALGDAVEYLAKTDSRWYRGTISSVDVTGYQISLDLGLIKSVAAHEATTRLRVAAAAGYPMQVPTPFSVPVMPCRPRPGSGTAEGIFIQTPSRIYAA